MGTNLFTTFQNGVGPQGQPSPDGNTDSTIVEFTLGGHEVHQWDLHGKCDGLTADPALGVVIATITPCDANSAPSTCPAPGFPPNYVGMINPFTGHISKVHLSGPRLEPQGMIFVAAP